METDKVHILFIDDNPGVIQEAREWLLEEFGYQNLETATSAKEAQDQLERGSFDVIVADMRLEKDDSGFYILGWASENNLAAVTIIFTANDSVKDCRRAFKSGAWDYISKSMRGNPFEALHESIQNGIAYLNRWGNQASEQLRRISELPEIADLIKRKEGKKLEFKSSLQWSVKGDKKDPRLHKEVLKTIVAFLNTEGGTLLIGVEDDGNIFGIEKDCTSLNVKKEESYRDQFEQQLINLIEARIGTRFLDENIKIRFENIEGKDVCAVHVLQSYRGPAFLKPVKGERDDTNNNHVELYKRIGNTSRVQGIPEIYQWF